jgi:site-specific DNA-methyltransferase (adenine-specific)
MMFDLRCVDAVDLLRSLDTGSVDCAVFDPAYESLEKHRVTPTGKPRGTTTRLSDSKGSSNEWFETFANNRYPELFGELWRVMRRQSHVYVFTDEESRDVMLPAARAAGFWHWKTIPCIKIKKEVPRDREGKLVLRDVGLDEPEIMQLVYALLNSGMGYHWRATVEFVMMLEKRTTPQKWPRAHPTGKGRQLNDRRLPDVFFAIPPTGGYPTEKCPRTVRRIIENSTAPGEVVLDCFAGSGVVGDVAVRCGRHFTGCDTKASAVEAARARLVEAHFDLLGV